MKILVTGGAGFIGSHTTDLLLERGHEVRILDSLDPQVHPAGRPDYLTTEAELRVGDVRDPVAVSDALDGVDAVLHLAASVGVGQSMYEIRRYTDVNAMGGATVLEGVLAHRDRVRRLVVASSMSIYGEGAYRTRDGAPAYPDLRPREQLEAGRWEHGDGENALVPVPTPETKMLAPSSVYAVGKRDHEELFTSIGVAYEIPTVALRYFNVFGSRQALSNPYTGVAAIFGSRLLNGNAPMIYEDGLQSRDFVHVSDIAMANALSLESDARTHEIFNVGSGHSCTILDVAHGMARHLGVDIEPQVVGKFRAGDIRHCFADVSRIRDRLGFEPKVGFDEGMALLVDWLRGQDANDRVDAAQEELRRRGLVV